MTDVIATMDNATLLEQVVVGGDLSRLTPADRLQYYKAVCESVGLNPLTRPFDYLTLSGRLVLYAKKDATDQLRKIHGVSITGLENKMMPGDLYVVTASAKDRDGRVDAATGAVYLGKAIGEVAANLLMKAECVPLDSEILTRRGFVTYDTLILGEEVLSYDVENDECVWTPLLNITTYDALPLVRLQTPSRFSVRCTPDHSWPVVRNADYVSYSRGVRGPRGPYKSRGPQRILVEARAILTSHKLIVAAPERKTTFGLLTPTEAAVLGWAVTDGTIQRRGRYVRVGICQSKEQNFAAIRSLVQTLAPDTREIVWHGAPSRTFPMTGKTYATLPQHWWYLPSAIGRQLLARAGYQTRKDLPRIAAALPGDARRAMLSAFMLAEGDARNVFANTDPALMETFQILAALEGKSTGRLQSIKGDKLVCMAQRLKKRRHIAGSNLQCEPIEAAPAWCPTTAYGTWVMRQGGQVIITGNTKAKRRVTLSLCGLGMLDESEIDSIPGAIVGEPKTTTASSGSLFDEEERHSLIAEATRLGKELKMTATDKRAVMLEHLGASDPDLFTVDIASLATMVAALKKLEDTKKART